MRAFKVGDKIVDFSQVFRIFKTKRRKKPNGEKEKVIFFRPYFKTPKNQTLVCSIPVKNIKKTKIRRPISKKKLKELLKSLSQKSDIDIPINISRAKDMLNSNDPEKIAWVLKGLWLEKNDESTNFTKNREKVFKIAIKELVEEIAFVSGTSTRKAKKRIKKYLKKKAN
jgi:RNA polymerase-interacting CarD/CdnL/TRCF family regulator